MTMKNNFIFVFTKKKKKNWFSREGLPGPTDQKYGTDASYNAFSYFSQYKRKRTIPVIIRG